MLLFTSRMLGKHYVQLLTMYIAVYANLCAQTKIAQDKDRVARDAACDENGHKVMFF